MVIAASKILLLCALFLGRVESAVSRGNEEVRGLSFRHPSSHSNDIDETKQTEINYYSKSGKGSKSGGKGSKSVGKGVKSEKIEKSNYGSNPTNADEMMGYNAYASKITKGSGKNLKSEKQEKYVHTEKDFGVEYQIVVDEEDSEDIVSGSKSSKNRPMIPEFEFIEIGHKSFKSSKSGKANYGYSDSTELKNEKSYKEGKSSKDKLPKTPTVSPVPTDAPAPNSSPRPTEVGSFGVGVPLYSLAYILLSKKEPTMEELKELEKATRGYLSDFFFDEFDEDDFTVFEQFITDMINYSASKNNPVVVDYESVARFDSSSLITPTPTQLGSAVKEAFTGLHMIQYEDWLKEMLPSKNIFVGSKVQYYEDGKGVPDKARYGIGATGIAASAVALTLLTAGVVLYKSKSNGDGGGTDKLEKSPGDMTVAGETYAGETYDGTVSVSAASVDHVRRYNDEEEGTKVDNLGSTLGSIPESHYADSVRDTFRDGIAPKNISSAFRGGVASTGRKSSFQDVALQAPTYGSRFQENTMPDTSAGDDRSQMSDSELSQFVDDKETSGDHSLEIKSILSLDSMDDNVTSDLSIRDNSSRRLRTVAEIEALLSSELQDSDTSTGSRNNLHKQHQADRPRTVEEIESLLTAEDDESIIEISVSDEDESIVE